MMTASSLREYLKEGLSWHRKERGEGGGRGERGARVDY